MFLSILTWCKKHSVPPPGHKSGRASCPGLFYTVIGAINALVEKIFPKRFEEKFISDCSNGNIKAVQESSPFVTMTAIESGMKVAISKGNQNIVQYLLEKECTPTEQDLTLACELNRLEIAEMIIAAGKKLSPPMPITAGLRVAKSNNIIRMLYRYEQNSDNLG